MPAVLAQAKNPDWGEPLNRLLQELAWDAVRQHPLSGVSPTAKERHPDAAVTPERHWTADTKRCKVG
jgi:hypothetical protein